MPTPPRLWHRQRETVSLSSSSPPMRLGTGWSKEPLQSSMTGATANAACVASRLGPGSRLRGDMTACWAGVLGLEHHDFCRLTRATFARSHSWSFLDEAVMVRQLLRASTLRAVSVATLLSAAAGALAQDSYPNRLIRIVVPAPPGTVLDSLPRFVADKLAARWKQPVIIENRPGAAQNIGAEAVAKAAPDGYTLLATPEGRLVLTQYVFSNLGFDPSAFVPVSVFVTQPTVLVANPQAPYSSLQEMLSFANANPGKASYGSPGTGSSLHLIAEMLQTSAGVRLLHVPYKGMAPAMSDLLAGHIAM